MRATARAAVAWIPLNASNEEIRDLAVAKARDMWSLAGLAHDAAALRTLMNGRCARLGITPPPPCIRDLPAVRRMTDAAWWRRNIRRTQGRLIEETAIALGYVHRRRDCYASEETVQRKREQDKRNASTLEAVELENQFGYAATVAELAAKGTANPRIKLADLMTRMSGFESLSQGLGYAGLFITVTCPSRFHAVRESGRRNPKHDGSTPRDAQRHLVTTWAKCRAALHRRGIRVFGLRVAEAHHDATPHWHLLLFINPDQAQTLRALVLRFFLEQHDPDERGARQNRVKFVDIDPDRGSACGYLVKYLAKGISGEQLDGDHYGHSGAAAAERVRAWASTWGIRQFQQIGGAPVTTWRELRRMEADPAHPQEVAAARIAADVGNWARYVELQGGPTVARADLAIRTAYTDEGQRIDPDTGEAIEALNQFGEPAAPVIFGVRATASDRAFLSRRFRWTARRAAAAEEAPRRRCEPWRAQRDSGKAEGRAAGEAGTRTRTRVINCTGAPAGQPGGSAPVTFETPFGQVETAPAGIPRPRLAASPPAIPPAATPGDPL